MPDAAQSFDHRRGQGAYMNIASQARFLTDLQDAFDN
jgi:hypothetical protein